MEILIIDDGTDDGSDTICGEYAEKDLCIVVIHRKTEGSVLLETWA